MRVLVGGATGFIGTALTAALETQGHAMSRLVRGGQVSSESTVQWDPASGTIDATALEGFDAVVHLGGENIASGRWTPARKVRIRESRVAGTRLLCEALAKIQRPPEVLVCASAVGFYGNRGREVLDEESPAGEGFLAEVCQAWEDATRPAASAGIRVVNARFGAVLARHGGALAKMLPLFTLGLGGVLGSGRQYLSWVALDDAVGAVLHVLATKSLAGPVNVVAPEAVTNREFTKTLGKVLHRPTWCWAPAFALRLALGEMADGLLLSSQRVVPKKLRETGYEFLHPDLAAALG